MTAKAVLFGLLVLFGVVFVGAWLVGLRATKAQGGRVVPSVYEVLVGAITDFFDTLGIGSYATTTTLYRTRRTVDDRLLPGTLTVGHTLPTFAEAFIFIEQVRVDPLTLASMIAAATAGALVGAPVVASWPRRQVQIGLAIALLVVCAVLVWRQIGIPTDGLRQGLRGGALALAVGVSLVLGALMTIGVGLYAPCLVLVSLLGMDPKAGFPIMMGSCAFLQALASVPFIRRDCYAPAATVGLSLGGLPAVFVAAFLVKELPLYWVKWLVAVVVVITAASLLRSARRPPSAARS